MLDLQNTGQSQNRSPSPKKKTTKQDRYHTNPENTFCTRAHLHGCRERLIVCVTPSLSLEPELVESAKPIVIPKNNLEPSHPTQQNNKRATSNNSKFSELFRRNRYKREISSTSSRHRPQPQTFHRTDRSGEFFIHPIHRLRYPYLSINCHPRSDQFGSIIINDISEIHYSFCDS